MSAGMKIKMLEDKKTFVLHNPVRLLEDLPIPEFHLTEEGQKMISGELPNEIEITGVTY